MKTITFTPEQIDILNEALEYYGEEMQYRIDTSEGFYEDDEIEEFEDTISVIDSIQELL